MDKMFASSDLLKHVIYYADDIMIATDKSLSRLLHHVTQTRDAARLIYLICDPIHELNQLLLLLLLLFFQPPPPVIIPSFSPSFHVAAAAASGNQTPDPERHRPTTDDRGRNVSPPPLLSHRQPASSPPQKKLRATCFSSLLFVTNFINTTHFEN